MAVNVEFFYGDAWVYLNKEYCKMWNRLYATQKWQICKGADIATSPTSDSLPYTHRAMLPGHEPVGINPCPSSILF